MTRTERKLEKLQAQCDRFNAECPVGTEVLVKTDTQANIITKTRSAAYVLSGHTPVVFVEGISGCYLLDRVSKIYARFERQAKGLVMVGPVATMTDSTGTHVVGGMIETADERTSDPNPAVHPNSNKKES